MTIPKSQQTDGRLSEMTQRFQELQSDTIILATPVLFIFGMLILGDISRFANTYVTLPYTLVIFALAALAWLLRRRSFLFASLIQVLCFFGVVFLAVIEGQIAAAVFLLILPVGIATLTLGVIAGCVLAFAATGFLLFFPGPFEFVGTDFRFISVLGIWCTVGMIWLTLRPLLSTAEWAWSGYEHSMMLLEQAQEFQVKLLQALDDLKFANSQLVRLNQLAQNLRQAAEAEKSAKEQFVANVSHELRTPLNMIVGFCETILHSPQTYGQDLAPSLIADLEVILRNGQHLSNLIDDVLDLSQMDSGQMTLSKEFTSFPEILEIAKIAVRPLFESKGLFLKTEVQDNLPLIYCDKVRIREVLLNLLSNAGRFTERGGVTVKVYQETNNLLVSVNDTGPGIATEEQPRLFKPFQQLDGSIRRRFGGTGLGLSISKSFVELHDGRMWVESVKDLGSTFCFTIPIQPLQPLETKATRWINPYMHYTERNRPFELSEILVKPRLVVVEKEGIVLSRLLGRFMANVEIIQVPDLEMALLELKNTPSRALFINTSRLAEITSQLSEPGVLPFNIPVIACSLPGTEHITNELGVVNYLVKPISQAKLLEAIDAVQKPIETILIVDDEPDILQLFRRMLSSSKRGYRALRASDGQQALKVLKRQSVDLILLDLVMPEMNGFQFIAAKNQDPNFQNIPIILTSARDPQGQPIATNTLMITNGGGLSAPKLLACINALLGVFSPPVEQVDPKSSESFPD